MAKLYQYEMESVKCSNQLQNNKNSSIQQWQHSLVKKYKAAMYSKLKLINTSKMGKNKQSSSVHWKYEQKVEKCVYYSYKKQIKLYKCITGWKR